MVDVLFDFEYKLNKNDWFLSSMYYNYFSLGGLFSVLFTFFSVMVLIWTIINKTFYDFTIEYKIILILCCFIFNIIKPLLLYVKVLKKNNKHQDLKYNLKFFDDKFSISINNNNGDYNYNTIFKLKNYNAMCILMFDGLNGIIIPNRVFNNNKNDFVNFINNKLSI